MSERLRYEQQLADEWNDLPLPDENAAWADMKRRLDEDDNDPVVPFWLRGCALWGVLGLLLIAGGWWWYSNHNKKEHKKQNSEVVLQNNNDNTNQHPDNEIAIEKNRTANSNQTDTSVNAQQNKSISQATDSTNKTQPSASSKTIEINDGINGTTTFTPAASKIKSSKSKNVVAAKSTVTITQTNASSAKRKNSTSLITKASIAKKKNDKKTTDVKDVMIDTKVSLSPSEKNEKQQTDSVKIIAVIKPDTAIVKKDSLSKQSQVIAETKKSPEKKDITKKNYWYFSTGIAEQQQLPLSGQSFVTFSASGRKGTLADYIPSVYARLHRNEKWFLQAEFRYAAPQYNKELTYISRSVVDTTQTVTKTTQRVKKTYYHQLPFSFNYYVLPNWSVGTGVVFNKFYSAVTVQDILQRRAGTTTDTFLVKNKIASQRNADSNFVNSFFQLLFETQYKYKRFSFGARYTQGLSPYIKLNVPGGPSQEKNKSLQIFLRYELWNSKKK